MHEERAEIPDFPRFINGPDRSQLAPVYPGNDTHENRNMKKTREEIQNGYWNGGEIEGRTFHKLNLERKALLQAVWAKVEESGASWTTGDQTKVAMAIYNMCDLDVENAEPDVAKLVAVATEKGLARMSLAGADEFETYFARDVAAMLASGAKIAGHVDE